MSQGNRMAEYLRVLLIIRIPQESRSFPKVKHVFEQAFERIQSPLANLHPTCRPPPPFPGQVVKTPHRQSPIDATTSIDQHSSSKCVFQLSVLAADPPPEARPASKP
jgi:hypothetical protein